MSNPTVAVIGHGKSPVGRGWGPCIDACDIVVRLWDNQWQDEADWGKKYDYGYLEISTKQIDRFNAGNVNTPVLGWVGGILKPTDPILYPPNIKVLSLEPWITRGMNLGGVGTTGRFKLSRGCAAAAWAVQYLGGEVTLVGFDNVYTKSALPPDEAFPEVYLRAPTTSSLKNYTGGGTKFHNHDYVAEGDLLWSLAKGYGVDIAHAQDRWPNEQRRPAQIRRRQSSGTAIRPQRGRSRRRKDPARAPGDPG